MFSKDKRKVIIQWLGLGLMLVLLIAIAASCWGDPLFKLIVENQTGDTLSIKINEREIGTVSPGQQISDKFGVNNHGFLVTAKNVKGEIIFSKTFTIDQMQEVESQVYKVVIKH